MSFLDEFLKKPLPSANPVMEGVDDFDDSMSPIINNDGDIDGDGDIDIPENDPINDTLDKPDNFDLSPEEDAAADSIINIAATPVIMNQILDQETMKEFVSSSEFDIAVAEGFAYEGSQESFVPSMSVFTEAQFYSQNTVRLTKQARTNQLFEICVQAIAKAKNDPVYAKLEKAQQVRRKLKAILRQRYRGPAMKKAKEYIARMRNSGSKTISNAAKNMQ